MINECYVIKEPIHAMLWNYPRGKNFQKVSLRPLTLTLNISNSKKFFHLNYRTGRSMKQF